MISNDMNNSFECSKESANGTVNLRMNENSTIFHKIPSFENVGTPNKVRLSSLVRNNSNLSTENNPDEEREEIKSKNENYLVSLKNDIYDKSNNSNIRPDSISLSSQNEFAAAIMCSEDSVNKTRPTSLTPCFKTNNDRNQKLKTPPGIKNKNTKIYDLRKELSNLNLFNNSGGEDFFSLSIKDKKDLTNTNKDTITKIPFIEEDSKRKKKTSESAVPPLIPSLFPNVPPTIYFSKPSEKITPLPKEIRNELIWELTTITPKLISQCVVRSGFRLKRKNALWIATWDKNLRCKQYVSLKDTQKVNHFPGSFHLGRKDRLWMNITKMKQLYGNVPFSFMPETFILPEDLKRLRETWQDEEWHEKWIIKPPASARGIGIYVVHKWAEVPKDTPIIVQKYLSYPYLINSTKFDLRIYVLVTSFDPLRIYLFDDGLARFASMQYCRSSKFIGEKFMHLTNYSVNKENSDYKINGENICEGHKWSLKTLWKYLEKRYINTEYLWSGIKDIVIKTLISCEDPISKLIRVYRKDKYSCYELFGLDIMLDNNLKPWLLEVNISPSLQSSSQLDIDIKNQLIKDMFNTVGYQIPDDINISLKTERNVLKMCNIPPEKTTRIRMNKDLFCTELSREEKVKHIRYEQKYWNEKCILKNLTGDDIRHLIESEDELSRCGQFQRIFPNKKSVSYLKYFKRPRYYNLLLHAWEKRYHKHRKSGIELLQSLCKEGKHLEIDDPDELNGIFQIGDGNTKCMTKQTSNESVGVNSLKMEKLFNLEILNKNELPALDLNSRFS